MRRMDKGEFTMRDEMEDEMDDACSKREELHNHAIKLKNI